MNKPAQLRYIATVMKAPSWLREICRLMHEPGLQESERLTGAMQERLAHHAQSRQMNGELYRLTAAKCPVCNERYLNFVFMPLYPGTYSYIGECVISYHIACIELLVR